VLRNPCESPEHLTQQSFKILLIKLNNEQSLGDENSGDRHTNIKTKKVVKATLSYKGEV
jgi:hypothetical protein